MTPENAQANGYARQKIDEHLDQFFAENGAVVKIEIAKGTSEIKTLTHGTVEREYSGKMRHDVEFENGAKIEFFTKNADETESSNDN